jgi:hypothetical protein
MTKTTRRFQIESHAVGWRDLGIYIAHVVPDGDGGVLIRFNGPFDSREDTSEFIDQIERSGILPAGDEVPEEVMRRFVEKIAPHSGGNYLTMQ